MTSYFRTQMIPEKYLAEGWDEILAPEINKEYYLEIKRTISRDLREGKTVYPPMNLVLNAFHLTSFKDLKVVILGQDPYHNPGQAHGLSFSVPAGVTPPPSLKNIYKEIFDDTGIAKDTDNGCLESWSRQGVFLLNASLTVIKGEPGSHARIGWQTFTDAVIKAISDRKEHVVFMLWGNFAKSKSGLIDRTKHLVLEAAHPSPLAKGAFFGCRHFSKCNDFLKSFGMKEIEW